MRLFGFCQAGSLTQADLGRTVTVWPNRSPGLDKVTGVLEFVEIHPGFYEDEPDLALLRVGSAPASSSATDLVRVHVTRGKRQFGPRVRRDRATASAEPEAPQSVQQ